MKKIILRIAMVVFAILISVNFSALCAQSNKAKKTHDAIQKVEFEKADILLKELTEKNEEVALVYYLKYEFFKSKGSKRYNIDSAFFFLNNAYNEIVNEALNSREKFLEYFAFGIQNYDNQKKELIDSAFDIAKTENSIQSFNHFILIYGNNNLVDQAKSEIDKLLFENVIRQNSTDSLYLFKKTYPNSQYLLNVDERIVSFKLDNCKENESLECLNAIKSEFPKTKQLVEINKMIKEISERIATERFEKCIKARSIKCLEDIVIEFPEAHIVKTIELAKDKILFENHCVSKNIDSIYLFIKLYRNSAFKDQANLVFKKVIEDTISKLNSIIISDNWETIVSDFHPKFEMYNELNDSIENVKLNYEKLVFDALNSQSTKNQLDWFIKEFPNSNNLPVIKNLEKKVTIGENVAFFKELTGINYNKYGLLNMSTGNFLVNSFYDDVRKFCNGLAAVQLYGKWGYINKKGVLKIPFIYDEVRNFNDFVTGVELEGVWFLIDRNGERVSDNEYLFIGEFDNTLVNVKPYTGGWIYIDNNEQTKSPKNYYNAMSFKNSIAAVSNKDQEVLIIDQSFKVLNDITEILVDYIPYYGKASETKNIMSFEYCDKTKKHLINSHVFYDKNKNQAEALEPPLATDFGENELRFDLTGNFLVDGRDIVYYNGSSLISDLSREYYSIRNNEYQFDYTIRDNDVITYFNLYGSDLHPEKPTDRFVPSEGLFNHQVDYKLAFNVSQFKPFRLISFNKEYAVIQKETGCGIINKNGTLVNNHCSFESVTPFIDGISIVGSTAGYFLMDGSGQKCSGLYTSIIRLNGDLFIVSEKGSSKSFIIDKKGQILSASYDYIEARIINNTLLVSNSNGYKNYVELKVHGLIDITGKVLVPLIYDDVLRTYSNLVFGKCSNGNNRPCNFDIYSFQGVKVKALSGYLRYSVDSNGLKFRKVHYVQTNPNYEPKVIIDDEYILPNY
jgi:hypothetical protein